MQEALGVGPAAKMASQGLSWVESESCVSVTSVATLGVGFPAPCPMAYVGSGEVWFSWVLIRLG